MGGGALRGAWEVDGNGGSGGAHPTGKGRAPRAGPGQNSDSRMLRTCTKNCPKQKLPVAGSERGLPLGRVNRYSNYATIAIVLSDRCFVLVSQPVFIASLRGHTRSSRAQSTVT